MSPPLPPLPPSGPARGLNFSRRTETQPLPPCPARTNRRTSSTKLTMPHPSFLPSAETREGGPKPALTKPMDRLLADRHDVDDLAAALVAELHRAGLEREQGVVATATDARTRVEVRAALTDEDLARANDLAAEALHAEALGVRVTTVASRARSLFV